jgi:hypothetical protein
VLRRILDIAIREDILVPQAVYGYWQCAAEGNDVILFDTNGETGLTRFSFPRGTRPLYDAGPSSPRRTQQWQRQRTMGGPQESS